jgi:D-threonine aldolase
VKACGANFNGLHFYEGGEVSHNVEEREKACNQHYERLLTLREKVKNAINREPGALLTSGTPSYLFALKYEGFKGIDHRVGAGTIVYWDLNSDNYWPENTTFKYAATVLSRVLSRPTDNHFTMDAGSKAVAAEAARPSTSILNHPEYIGQGPSEEHFPYQAPKGDAPKSGEMFELVSRHICPTCNLAESAMLVEKDKCIKVVKVTARAHGSGPHPDFLE